MVNSEFTEDEDKLYFTLDRPFASGDEKLTADVISVSVSGEANNYQISIGIKSPDTGCDQYADWWEVLSEAGVLIYRRILTHSHVNE